MKVADLARIHLSNMKIAADQQAKEEEEKYIKDAQHALLKKSVSLWDQVDMDMNDQDPDAPFGLDDELLEIPDPIGLKH